MTDKNYLNAQHWYDDLTPEDLGLWRDTEADADAAPEADPWETWDPEQNGAVWEPATLETLRDSLNTYQRALVGTPFKMEDFVATDHLPVYGGGEPADTAGIYSWDATRLLVFDGGVGVWTLINR